MGGQSKVYISVQQKEVEQEFQLPRSRIRQSDKNQFTLMEKEIFFSFLYSCIGFVWNRLPFSS